MIRRDPETGENSLDLLKWGLIPSWAKEKPKPPPINARAETVAKLPMFRSAYTKRRCILPIDSFYEWKVVTGTKAKQPFAIGMKDRAPFGLASLWENWKDPATGEWVRTFAVVTTMASPGASAVIYGGKGIGEDGGTVEGVGFEGIARALAVPARG